jgi:acetyl-CoA carboxylase biotin carboxylase subunit
MQKSGVPVIPGSEGTVASLAEAMTTAHRIGYPILLKAAEGGGGKGIRAVAAAADLPAAFRETQREARLNYGDDRIYIEKLVTNAKHIEMQVIADTHGHIVYLPERDCSMQRHHQKVIEESPCQDITPAERAKLGNIVVQACHQIGYTNTGTFEFLMDSHHHFYFLEMNTRLQVEHTVTEEVTGLQLIKAMVRVAAGESLPFTQADAQVKGYALECRINAEDPANNFRPSPGTLQQLYLPDGTLGVRIDSGVTTGSTIPPFYDAMIAKLIVHLPTREETIVKMQRVLGECIVRGIAINRDFLEALLASPKFADAQYTTDYIEQEFLPEWRSKRDVTA